jgi:hypothetical protein
VQQRVARGKLSSAADSATTCSVGDVEEHGEEI